MNKYVKWIGLAVLIGLVALAATSVAWAQGGTPPTAVAPFGPGWGGMMGGGSGQGVLYRYRDQMHAPVAEALGLSLDEFNAQLALGQTPWLIAQEKGVDTAALQAAMQTGQAAALAQAVKDGVLTQAQADLMLAHHAQMAARHAAGSYGPMMGRGYRAGGGIPGNSFGPCHGGPAATPAPGA